MDAGEDPTPGPAQSPDPGRVLHATRLDDAGHCPVCGAVLDSPRCRDCGVDLSGPEGTRLWQVSQRAARLLEEREALLAQLRTRTRSRGSEPSPAPSVAPVPSAPVAAPVHVPPAAVAARPSLASRIGVQGLLVALGALLVAVAGIVFLVFAWDRLSLEGRALVVGGLTLAAMVGATWLRPRLPETAEGIGAIAVVLVLGDAWAIRATGLFGADRSDVLGYAALAAAATGALLLTWAALGGVRAGSFVGVVLAPASFVLGGAYLASRSDAAPVSIVGLGLVAASAIGVARVAMPPAWRGERRVLRFTSAAYWLLALLALPVWALVGPGLGTLVLLGAAVAAAGLAWADHREPAAAARVSRVPPPASGTFSGATADRVDEGWSLAAGIALALTAVPAGLRVIRWLDVTVEPLLAMVPVTAALLALLARKTCGPGRPVSVLSHRWTVRGARTVAVLATVPAVGVLLAALWSVGAASRDVWQAEAGQALRDALPFLAGAAGTLSMSKIHGYAVAGLLGTGLVLSVSRPVRWAAPAAALVAGSLLLAPLVPELPVAAAVITLLTVAVLAALVFRQVRRRSPTWLPPGPWRAGLVAWTALGLAVAATATAVGLSWTVRALCVPVTVVAAGALIGLRGVLPAGYRPAVWIVSVGSVTLAVGALPVVLGLTDPAVIRVVGGVIADAPGPFWLDLRAAGVTAALLGAVLAGVPAPEPPRPAVAERAAGAITGMVLAGVPVVAVLARDAVAWGAAWGLLVCAALLLTAVAAALYPASEESPAGDLPPVLGALVAPAALVLVATAPQLTQPDPDWATVRIVAAAAIAVCGFALGVLGALAARAGRAGDDRRVPAAEAGTLVPLVVVALAALNGPLTDFLDDLASSRWDPRAWIAPLLLGVAATALAMAPARRRLAWLGWLLVSASNAIRFLAGGVAPGDVIEAFTLPPALALLAVSAVRLRLDREGTSRSTLLPGLSLAVLPSVLAASTGPWQRPAVLIAVGGLALAASLRLDRRVRPALALAATAAAGGAGLVRAGHAVVTQTEPGWRQLEAWTVPSAVVVLAAGMIWLRSDARVRSWGPLGGGVALLLGPSLLAVLGGEPVWRVAVVAVLAAGTVAVGTVYRLQAPVLLGALVLVVHALVQLGPWVARVIAGQPRWLVLAVVGALLLALGATYERRLRELRAVRLRLSALR